MKQTNLKKIEVLLDAIVEFKNCEREIIDAIYISDKVILAGHLINDNEFMGGRGIPRENVKKIIGGKKRIIQFRVF